MPKYISEKEKVQTSKEGEEGRQNGRAKTKTDCHQLRAFFSRASHKLYLDMRINNTICFHPWEVLLHYLKIFKD